MDTQGRTPLHYAASRGHTEIMASLVQAAMATDPQDKLLDNKQYTPLHWAAYNGKLSLIDWKMSLFAINHCHIFRLSFPCNAACVYSQGMKTVWRFYLNLKHLSMKRETLSPPCTVLCEYLLFISAPPSVKTVLDNKKILSQHSINTCFLLVGWMATAVQQRGCWILLGSRWLTPEMPKEGQSAEEMLHYTFNIVTAHVSSILKKSLSFSLKLPTL